MASITIPFPIQHALAGDIDLMPTWAKNFIQEFYEYKKQGGTSDIYGYSKQTSPPVRAFYNEVEYDDELFSYALDLFVFRWEDEAGKTLFALKYS